MKLKFKELDYQIDAVNSICDIFESQPKKELIKSLFDKQILKNGLFEEEVIIESFANPKLRLANEEILKNLQKVQKKNSLKPSEKLDSLNFTVEMETGTGKTYVYTRTIFELNKRYGFSKFIIMTPSVAIREGVHKSLEITEEHFKELYEKKLRFFIYDTKKSSNLTNIKSFAQSSEIWVMIINYQAFATKSKDSRKIYEELDLMNSNRPIDLIKSTRPILIIDEPQKFGPTSEKKLKEFEPLFILRYSATHKNLFNQVYRLDALDAFNKKLVKKISVKGIEIKGTTATTGYLYLDEIILSEKSHPKTKVEFEIKQKSGVKRVSKILKEGDNLYELSNSLTQYKDGFIVSEINGLINEVKFLNGIVLKPGVAQGEVNEKVLRRIQIRETIKSHFEKEEELFKRGIKVLSLFFIDEVKKYRDYDKEDTKGEYAKIFEEEFDNVKNDMKHLFNDKYFEYLERFSTDKLHEGYFSIDKKGNLKDPKVDKEGNSNDESAYELIMKNKEKLLSFDTPVRFIFSHSALKEGWDNPNIFQICTLRHTKSTISKRQEIGRGLRICVDKDGNRMDKSILEDEFFEVNNLTIIANESYESFAKSLQEEIFENIDREIIFSVENIKGYKLKDRILDEKMAMDLVFEFKMNGYIDKDYHLTQKLFSDIENNRFNLNNELNEFKEDIVKLVQKVDISTTLNNIIENEKAKNIDIKTLKPNENFKKFEDFWQKIKFKTTYKIDFDSDELIKKVVDRINKELEIKKVLIKVVEATQKNKISLNDEFLEKKESKVIKNNIAISNIKYDLLGEISKATNLKRVTVAKTLNSINENKFNLFKTNPEEFILKVCQIIEEEKATTFINSISYTKSGEYDSDIWTINNFKGKIDKDIIELKKSVYDFLKYDSLVEKTFSKNLDVNEEVVVFVKFPHKFKIPTPAGFYTPDFGIKFKDTIYLVAETKGSLKSFELKGKEKAKIEYAKKHFESLKDIKYKVVTTIDEIYANNKWEY